MTLRHRAPREVYRVYGQDEYLAEDGGSTVEELHAASVDGCGDDGHPSVTSSQTHASRPARLVGLGLLVGVVVGVAALVVLNASHRSSAVSASGVVQSAPEGAVGHSSKAAHESGASHAFTRISAGSESATRASGKAVSRARASIRSSVRPLLRPRAERPTELGPSTVAVMPSQPQASESELPGPDAVASSIDGEFEFER